ncbi:MAG: VWA-like domain-containing protein, partial [Clostridiales bacterium]|nr:VWA-like domain-containing protein [Clostridiales bacterium]
YLKVEESFLEQIIIYIIQCDSQIQEIKKITSQKELDAYLAVMQLHGFGGTDFRPVFQYVERLQDAQQLTELKGLLYFTDGIGTYPQFRPTYETAFVFVEPDQIPSDPFQPDKLSNSAATRPDFMLEDAMVPVWAIKVLLSEHDLSERKGD